MHDPERSILQSVFRRGSRTFYWTSRLFPTAIRHDVEALYAFVRIADDCVDELPANPIRLARLEAASVGVHPDLDPDDALIAAAFRTTAARCAFDPLWSSAFFAAMRQDLNPPQYQTLADTLSYVYGSAEVIGLMMAQVMRVDSAHLGSAAQLGRAFQYINFIRDIGIDQKLGRTYIPASIIAKHGLTDLTPTTARAHPTAFADLIRTELARYRSWQTEGAAGIPFLPKQCRPAVRAACAAYLQTAARIEANPLSVYDAAYKPSKARLALHLITATLRP